MVGWREAENLLGAMLEKEQANDDPQDRQGQRQPLFEKPGLSHVTPPRSPGRRSTLSNDRPAPRGCRAVVLLNSESPASRSAALLSRPRRRRKLREARAIIHPFDVRRIELVVRGA